MLRVEDFKATEELLDAKIERVVKDLGV